ncbi:hypothetical protein P879_01528 [Paragonimus westermani]|uniref:DRBM domain-containing protein n=1 Tax=Paragonimus westermani TaxID=34504 RepID=A0A8T0DVA7_9TREM|nr:hypothetical protein P879_01528 [Paragonimus westermani]
MAKSDLVSCQSTLTPAAVLHERARIHRLGLSWCLVDEFGPPHRRTFCIKLTIHVNVSKTAETYEGLGGSIRAAKHAASAAALQQSEVLKRLSVTKENKTDRPPDAKQQVILNVIDNIPDPAGPRAEIRQLATILQVSSKFIRLPSFESPLIGHRQNYYSSLASSLFPMQVTTCRVALEFAGRQYVGEGTSRTGAEQEASCTALKALRCVLISVCARDKGADAFLAHSSDQTTRVRPNSAVWRLQVLAGLHRENPTFIVFETPANLDDTEIRSAKRRYTSSCSMPSFGTVEATGSSKAIACKLAALEMLGRLLRVKSDDHSTDSAISCSQNSPQTVKKKRHQIAKTRTVTQFKLDRANPNYSSDMDPVTRLQHVRLIRGLPEPTFILIHDQILNANGTQQSSRSSNSNRFSPRFTYEVRLAHYHVVGPSSGNKRLAKRLAAEAMLLELGFRRSVSPSLQSVLRCPRSALNLQPALSPTGSLNSLSDETEADPIASSGSADRNPTVPRSQEVRHITFSCARDVLILDDSVPTECSKPFSSRSRTLHLALLHPLPLGIGLMMNAKLLLTIGRFVIAGHRSNDYPTIFSTSLTLNRLRADLSYHIAFLFRLCFIELQEAQLVGRPLPTRRSRSCSDLSQLSRTHTQSNTQRTSWFDAMDIWADDNNDVANQSHSPPLPTNVKIGAPVTGYWPGRLGLLSRLSVFCLKEHLVHSNIQSASTGPSPAPNSTKQLLSLCQQLRIPCQFTDRAPKLFITGRETNSENAADVLMHHTVLTIGDTTFNDKTVDPTSGIRPVVVVHAVGRTRSLARQKASLSAFKQLAELQPNANS